MKNFLKNTKTCKLLCLQISYRYARGEVICEVIGTDKIVSQVFDAPIWIQAKRVLDYFEETIMLAYTVRKSSMTEHRMVYN